MMPATAPSTWTVSVDPAVTGMARGRALLPHPFTHSLSLAADCWAGGRNATGYLYPELDHFPNGLQPVIDYVHSKGLSFGLYTCGGNFTCVGGRPGSRDHWEQDAAVWAEWGVDWVKMDWCFSTGMVPQTAYGQMSRALNASGRHMAFSMCEWGVDNPWEWGNDIAQAWRMGADHTGNWDSTASVIFNSAQIPAQYSGRPFGWNDMDMLETGCYEQCAHANGRQPNMTADEYKTEFSMWAISASPLQITTRIMNCSAAPQPTCALALTQQLSIAPCTRDVSYGCSADNSSVWTTAGCRGVFQLNGAPVTCNINGSGVHECAGGGAVTCKGWLSALQKEIMLNTEVIAINQDVTPQGRPIRDGDLTVWARALSDGSVAVAFYNAAPAPASISVAFADLPAVGWSAATAASARDLWAHADLGSFTGRYPATGGVAVASHATHVVRLTKA